MHVLLFYCFLYRFLFDFSSFFNDFCIVFFFPTMALTEQSCEPSFTAILINFGPPGPLLLMPERAETPRGRVNFDVFPVFWRAFSREFQKRFCFIFDNFSINS